MKLLKTVGLRIQLLYAPTDVAGISRTTYTLAILLLLIVIIWMLTAPLASAVVISGTVKVFKNRVVLQHPDGGMIESLSVQDGDRVNEGQVLLTLTNPQLISTNRSLERQLFSELYRLQRLHAEIAYPKTHLMISLEPNWDAEQKAIAQTEMSLFEVRIRNLQTQEQSIKRQIAHVQSEMDALRRGLANERQILERTQDLARQGFVSSMNTLTAEQAIHQREADLARAQQRVAELEQRLPVLQEDFRNASASEYRTVSERVLDLQERLRPALQAQQSLQIKAITSGTIVNLTRLGPGSVLGAKEIIAELVPTDRGLILEGSLSPEQVTFIKPNMRARIRINQLLKLGVDEFEGEVKTVSADIVSQGMLSTAVYVVRVDIGEVSTSTMDQLRPGMPVEIFIQTGTRTLFQYLTQPITDFLKRAIRE